MEKGGGGLSQLTDPLLRRAGTFPVAGSAIAPAAIRLHSGQRTSSRDDFVTVRVLSAEGTGPAGPHLSRGAESGSLKKQSEAG